MAVKTAATQTKPACAGSKSLNFPLVRAGGLGFCSREFHSPGLKLTPMGNAMSLTTLPESPNCYEAKFSAQQVVISQKL
ncbi:hypothetical protein NDA00_17310 [Funiculus sociatus GB2-M2]